MLSLRSRHRLRAKLWLLPLLFVLGGIVLSLVTVGIDRRFDDRLIPQSITGSATSAADVLSTIASAMVTMTTVVLTVTTVTVQLAMGQFSPRIVRALLQGRSNQVSYGVFAATFTFAMLALREVEAVDGNTVPGVTVLVAYLLMLVSVVVLFVYIDRSGAALRASGLIDIVGDHLREQLDQHYPPTDPEPADASVIVTAEPGIVVDFDRAEVVAAAQRADCILELVPILGSFVPVGSALFRVHGSTERLDHTQIANLVILGSERTPGNDAPYCFRKLADIAERCLAEPFNDPTTAVMVIDRLHDCLRQLAVRPFPDERLRDGDGEVRLIERTMSWDGYVRLAFDELRMAGAGSIQIPRRLRAALEDLKAIAPPERHGPLDRQLRLLTTAVERVYEDRDDVRAALIGDVQGIGDGKDLRGPQPTFDGQEKKSNAWNRW